MRLLKATAATTLLVIGYLTLEGSAASIDQFRYDFDDKEDTADGQRSTDDFDDAATRDKREEADYDSPYDMGLEDRYRRSSEENYDFPGNMNVDNGYKRDADYEAAEAREQDTPTSEDIHYCTSTEDIDVEKRDDDYDAVLARLLTEPDNEPEHFSFPTEPVPVKTDNAARSRRYADDSDDYSDEDYSYLDSPESAETDDEESTNCESSTSTPDEDDYDEGDSDEAVTEASPDPESERLESPISSPSDEETVAPPPKDVEVFYDAPNAFSEATLESPPPEGIVIYPVSSDELPDERELGQLQAAPSPAEVEAGQEYRIAGNVHLEAVSQEKRSNYDRKKRATGGLEEYKQKFLQLFNDLRARNGMPPVVLDPALTAEAQAWADDEAQHLEKKHSCTDCTEYAELLAKRRSPRPLPQGVEAAEWVYESWFTDEEGGDDSTFDVITRNPNFTKLGAGMSYRRAPDRSYHAYAVVRFKI